MRYCNSCVQPDTRPGIHFNEDGICGACQYELEKKNIDWAKRQAELHSLTHSLYPSGAYDCVLGVSGGKDSTYAALYARDKLNLRCLLVNSEPEGITEIGRHNIENLINLGFDCIKMRPNPKIMKQLVKRDFYKFLNPVKITEYSLWASAYIIAQKFDIPLIIQGENPALTLGTSKDVPMDGDALNADKQNTLKDGWTQYTGDGILLDDLFMFHYDRSALQAQGVKGIWIQYYDKDWSPSRNAEFALKHGLKIRENFNPADIGTRVPYAQLDSDLVPVNQMFKYYKFGFGQETDYCCYDIREGTLKRDEAWDLLEKYDGKCGDYYIEKFCKYIDITEYVMWKVIGEFVNQSLFTRNGNKWVRKFEYPRSQR